MKLPIILSAILAVFATVAVIFVANQSFDLVDKLRSWSIFLLP